MAKDTKSIKNNKTIALNRKAKFEFHIEEKFEAGIVLEGWEVKSIKAGRIQLIESHVIIRNHEVFLLNCNISPLESACTHQENDPRRTRKLLLHQKEIKKLIGYIDQKGYTLVPTAMYWKGCKIKLEVAIAKGKKLHDKRASLKEKEMKKQQLKNIKLN